MGALGASAVTLVALGWIHRVEVIQAPFYWHRVRALEALRASRPDHPAFQGTLNYGLSPFDVAVSKLIRVQRPEFPGAKRARILPVTTREKELCFLVSYHLLEVPFDREPDPKEPYSETVIFCPVVVREVGVVDGRGRMRGPRVLLHLEPSRERDAAFEILRDPGGFDVLRAGSGCLRGGDPELSVDRDGVVLHGSVREPVHGKEVIPPGDLDRLLDSGRTGDLHRALALLDTSDGRELHRIEPLLDHPDPRIRAHAAEVLARDPSLARLVLPLCGDPSPRVRLAALRTVKTIEGHEEAIRPLTVDPRAEIAEAAHCALLGSRDAGTARASAVHLYRMRYESMPDWDCERFKSPELALAIVDWLEDLLHEDQWSRLAENLRTCLGPDDLLPVLPRVIAMFEASEPEGWLRRELALCLEKVDHPAAHQTLGLRFTPEEVVELCEEAWPSEEVEAGVEVSLMEDENP